MASWFLICVLSNECPLDGSLQRVSRLLPGIDLASQELFAVDAPVQALAAEDACLDFCHVQPACVLGRVVEFDAPQQLRRGTNFQHIIETLPEVGVQVVHDQVNAACLGIRPGEQLADEGHEGHEGHEGDLALDRDDPLSSVGLNGDKQVGRAVADVLVIVLGGNALGHCKRLTAVANELQALLVNANHRLHSRQRPCLQLGQVRTCDVGTLRSELRCTT